MNVCALAMAMGALMLVEQDVEGIRVGGAGPVAGRSNTNFRHADIDRDGEPDVLFAESVVFQRNGRLAEAQRVALPRAPDGAAVDEAGGIIYQLVPVVEHATASNPPAGPTLRSIRWDKGEWTTEQFALEAPSERHRAAGVQTSGEGPARLARFLYELDGENEPEIVQLDAVGAKIWRRSAEKTGTYVLARQIELYPRMMLADEPTAALWPRSERTLSLPVRMQSCKVALQDGAFHVVWSEPAEEGLLTYRERTYFAELADGVDAPAKLLKETEIGPLPGHLSPVALNDDGRLDFAGGLAETTRRQPLPLPMYRTSVSLDGGRTVRNERALGFRPHCSFVDFNGDGRLDLIKESTDVIPSDLREAATRLLTRRSVEHTVTIYLQDAAGTSFSSDPDVQRVFRITLDRPPAHGGEFFDRYRSAELVQITGDFDGDGRTDALIVESSDQVSIYAGRASGFASEPVAELRIEPGRRVNIADVDGDGRSDVIVRWLDWDATDSLERSVAYLSRDGG